MRATMYFNGGSGVALVLLLSLCACGKPKQEEPRTTGTERAEARRHRTACASTTAYNKLKTLVFDQAVQSNEAKRANLDTLADYSLARMEDPVVDGVDPALDITRCKGRFILQIPAGAERGFAGANRLQADINYTAQGAADGNGYVYQLTGAKPIIKKLAAFNLSSGAYRPPPAIDQTQAAAEAVEIGQANLSSSSQGGIPNPPGIADERIAPRASPPPRQVAERPSARPGPEPIAPRAASAVDDTGEAVVRGFYDALRAGDGRAASARIIPEKRAAGAYSAQAMSRFYGDLPEPIRLTGIVPLKGGAYRVSYSYSAGRSHCNGSAIVRTMRRGDRDLIRSITALDGC